MALICAEEHAQEIENTYWLQLARHGANVHHVTPRPDGTTALHECVARGHDRVADLLLNYGASPFLENGRGVSQIMSSVGLWHTSFTMTLGMKLRISLLCSCCRSDSP
jgi:hypothetical protein